MNLDGFYYCPRHPEGSATGWRLGPRRIPTRMAPGLHAAAVLIANHGDLA